MRKGILLLSAALTFATLTQAQKLALYEEFSGENCGPCATYNPGLMTLLNANPTKVLLIKYQTPIPSGGSIYLQNTSDVQTKMTYYGINSAPTGLINGVKVGSGTSQGHIALTTQAIIDAAAAEATPFTMAIGTPTITGSNFSATVTITSNAAVSNANLKLRFALVEDLEFSSPPGTNGETSFHHVMRDMYPDATGTSLLSSFTAGQTQTITVTGTIPSYVSAENARMFIGWIQDETTKVVYQSAKSSSLPTAPLAIASESIALSQNLKCGDPNTTTFDAVVTIKNTGTTTLTSAQIYAKAGSNSYGSATPWNGSLAPGATTTKTITGIPAPSVGILEVRDSVAMPNGQPDVNVLNNATSTAAYLLSTTATSLNISNDFEATNANWIGYAPSTNGFPLIRAWSGNASQPLGHNNSTYFIYARNPYLDAGTVGYYIMPKASMPAGAKALDFYYSYAMRDAAGDKLEVVYTTNCGTSWTTVWSKSNADLATAAATTGTTLHLPTAASWKMISLDMSSVPDGAYVAFRATSGAGNYIFIDDVKLRTGAPNGIEEILETNTLNLYPNPAQNTLNVAIEMKKTQDVTFTVTNTLGQEVNHSNKSLNVGAQTVNIDVAGLASGMYYLNIKTDNGTIVKKFVKN